MSSIFKKLFIAAGLFIAGAACASAQVHGTEQMSIRSICQDEDGLIWFGTEGGLYSFDGYDVRRYGNSGQDKEHIQINSCVIKDGRLLLGTNSGLWEYDRISDKLTLIDHLQGETIRSLACNGDLVMIGAESGLFAYDPSKRDLVQVELKSSSAPVSIYSLLISGDDLFIGMITGVGRYSMTGRRYEPFEIKSGNRTASLRMVGAVGMNDDGSMLVGASNSLMTIDTKTGEIISSSPFPIVKTICRNSSGNILVGTDSGLYEYDPVSGSSVMKMSGVIWCLFLDRDGNSWIGTDYGLVMDNNTNLFKPVDSVPSTGGNDISTLLMDSKGRLWAGGTMGLLMFTEKEGRLTLDKWYKMNDPVYPIQHSRVRKVIEDKMSKEVILVGDAGLMKLDEASGQFRQINIKGRGRWAYDMAITDETTWIATFDGIEKIQDGAVVRTYNSSDGLSTSDVSEVEADGQGNIWILTRDHKVYYLDMATDIISKFDLTTSIHSNVSDILSADGQGRIWIGSGQWVATIVREGTGWKERSYNIGGSPASVIFAQSEHGGYNWLSTSEGIVILKENSETVRRINNGRMYPGIYKGDDSDTVVLSGLDKIDLLSRKEVERFFESSAPDISITEIIVNNEWSVGYDDLVKKEIVLPHNHNTLKVSFSDFSYSGGNMRQFHFRLEDGKAKWMELSGAGNTILLPNLSSGKHRLTIAATGYDDDACVLSIRIKPPFYQSAWAMILYALLLLGTAMWIFNFMKLRNSLELERSQRDALIEQAKNKVSFFTDVAHEFKTPLSLIIAPLSRLIQETPDEEQKKMLKIAHDNAMKLSSLIHLSIDYYRDTPDDVTGSIVCSEVEFVDFAQSIFLTYKESYPELEFIFNTDNDSIPVKVDLVKMDTILNNLLSNACKYTPSGGSVILTVRYDKESAVLGLTVSDTGIGIPEGELPFIFQRYFQSSRTTSGNYEGTGVGLSIIKNYVDMMMGQVGVSSDEHGTTFSVSIPADMDTTLPAAAVPEDELSQEDKPLIMIVEDNKSVADFLVTLLSGKYRCICAYNGKSGLKLCKDVLPDLIISDVVMPVMDGLEMSKEIRQFSPLSTVPIILLTAKRDFETENKSIRLNIDAYVTKPFDANLLMARVDQLVGNKKRMMQQLRIEQITKPDDHNELSQDEKFLVKITQMIEQHMDDTDLSVAKLCELSNIGEKQLYRKIKQLTGMTTVAYIRSLRLKKAAILLQNGNFTISEVMYTVGFSNPSYFARTFYTEFGKTPSEYMESFKQS